MLQGRLIAAIAAAALTLAACGTSDDDSGAIRENVVEPGVSAVEDGGGADLAACTADAATLRSALESYALLEGDAADDEAALVEAGYLRTETERWDVLDGEIVAVDPSCAAADVDVEAIEIVTSTSIPSVDEVLAGLSADEIEAIGGPDCARELAEIYAAGERLVAQTGEAPEDLDDLVDAGALSDRPELWVFTDDDLAPAEGSGCAAPGNG